MTVIMITTVLVIVALLTGWVTQQILGLRRIVPTNQVHIVQRADTATSYGVASKSGNKYYEFPTWVPFIGVNVVSYPVSVFDIDLMNYEAYDKDRLPFVVDVKAFFRIDDSDIAAKRVSSFTELHKQLIDIVRGAVRSLLANSNLESIMQDRSVYGNRFTEEVAPQLKEWGVVPVKNIELMDIRDSRDSEVIARIMAKKKSQIEMESRTEVAKNQKVATQAEIEASREVALKEEGAREDVGRKQAEVTRTIGIAKEKAEQEIKEQAKTTAEKTMAIKKVEQVEAAKISKEAASITAEQHRAVAEINAQANKNVLVVTAEAEKIVQVTAAEGAKDSIELKAEADLTAKTKDAQGIELQGLAIAVALKEKELASVTAQTTLAKEIGANLGYQGYLVNVRQVEAAEKVGIEQAKNLGRADIKIFSTGSTVEDGVKSAMGTFSPKLGLGLASAIEAFKSTPAGQDVATTLTGVAQKIGIKN